MKESVFIRFLEIIETLTGMTPPASHHNHIRRELGKEFKNKDISLEKYLELSEEDTEFQQILLNASTINETYFFREEKQFVLLKDDILPALFKKKQKTVIWSVSCSTGEEAVSLAILAEKEKIKHSGRDYMVYASDINTKVLDTLKKGKYGLNSLRKDGSCFHDILKDYLSGKKAENNGFYIDNSVLDKILTRRVNLYTDTFDFPDSPADIIFFRNTLLYMILDKRKNLLEKLSEKLTPGGYFFLASSEVPFVNLLNLDPVEMKGVYFFRKKKNTLSAGKDNNNESQKKPVMEAVSFPDNNSEEIKMEKKYRLLDEKYLIKYCLDESSIDRSNHTENQKKVYKDTVENIRLYFKKLNNSDFTGAQEILEKAKEGWQYASIFPFLEGLLFSAAGNKDSAIRHFYRSAGAVKNFWPARFYYAINIKEKDPVDACREFKKCLENLEEEISKGENHYSFILEGFDPAYFKYICLKWIEKLQSNLAIKR